MKTSNLSYVPLNQATLCLDCEMITAAVASCPACGSSALMNMARALSSPGYNSQTRVHNAAVNGTYARPIEHQTFFARQERAPSPDFRFACFQGE